jgi:hypothetical protein
MKRTLPIIILLFLLVVLVVVVAAKLPEEVRLPPGAQDCLDQYIAYTFPPGTAHVQAVERARRPENLSEDEERITFGDSVHFQTDSGPTHTQRLDLSTLYFPPKEVWCVLLARQESGARSYSVVFAGLHMDMHNGDWVIHYGPQDLAAPEFMETLRLLGCDLEISQMGPRNAEYTR